MGKSGPSRLENRLFGAKNRKNEDEEIRGRENSLAAEIEPVPLMFQTMLTGLTLIPIQELTDRKQLKQFDSGIDELNSYLSLYAQKNDSLGMGKTFLALDKDGAIQRYFTLAIGQVSFASLPSGYAPRLTKDPIPVLRLARLAVSKERQRTGIGRYLLTQIFLKVLHVADITGLHLIIVDAKETSKGFYEKYGFQKFGASGLTYFLPVETVRMAMQ